MKINKKSAAIATAVIATVSIGSWTVADAATTKSTKNVAVTKPTIGGVNATAGANPLKSVLDGLVTKGTITQAQEDAIVAAFQAAKPTFGANDPADGPEFGGPHGGMGGMNGANQAAEQSAILATLGIDATTLNTARAAGKSLATIAGTKTQALIDALVALENKEIDAAVTAGKLTATQATTQKANTVAHVTAQVNATPGQPGMGGVGHMGGHGRGPAPVAPAAPSTNG
jgi:hypothetical protein